MRRLTAVAVATILAVVSVGCAITDYPVIFDSRGADGDAVLLSLYDKAYVVPSGQVATIWDDGSDELFTLVSQNWMGDQWLDTYVNFDPTATVLFLDQTYCDPTYEGFAWKVVLWAWNPDLPQCDLALPMTPNARCDDPFDYVVNPDSSGLRSLSLLVSYTSRIGECGSGVWADKQAAAYEFSQLDHVTFRGKSVYHLPIDGSIASFRVKDDTDLPIYGRFNLYLDDQLRLAVPVTPNARYQLRALQRVVEREGHALSIDMTYGSLNATFNVFITTVDGALDRL